MMGVFIKGMEMPKNCDKCNIRDIHLCKLWMRMTISQRIEEKHPDCPLIEVTTPHGRLIDADELEKKMDERMDRLNDNRSIYDASCVAAALDLFAPTIIGAEGSEE